MNLLVSRKERKEPHRHPYERFLRGRLSTFDDMPAAECRLLFSMETFLPTNRACHSVLR